MYSCGKDWRGGKVLEAGKFAFDTKNSANIQILDERCDPALLPHQLRVLKRAMENNTIRYILADEVGLGKTMEVGMAIKELKPRSLI